MNAEVRQIIDILPHPHPKVQRLETIVLDNGIVLVVGKHYRIGDKGIWLKPGMIIPGWLAEDLWLVGKERTKEPFEVREIPIMGHPSPGLWCGMWYKNDKSKESLIRESEMRQQWSVIDFEGFTKWPYWNDHLFLGQILDETGVAQLQEQSVINRKVDGEIPSSGSNA